MVDIVSISREELCVIHCSHHNIWADGIRKRIRKYFYEIKAAQEHTGEDLDYNNFDRRAVIAELIA